MTRGSTAAPSETPVRHEMPPETYRAVSLAAVLALGFGVASAGALLGMMLWFLPVAAVACGLVALRRIARNDTLTGERLAVLGIWLGLAFGSFSAARYFTQRWLLFRDARAFAEQCLAMLNEKHLHEVHQLHLTPGERLPTGSSLGDFYSQPTNRETYERFTENPSVQHLLKGLKSGNHQWVSNESLERHREWDGLIQRFDIDFYDVEKRRRRMYFVIETQRHIRSGPGGRWSLKEIRLIDPPRGATVPDFST